MNTIVMKTADAQERDIQEEIGAYLKVQGELETKYMGKWVLFHDRALIAVYETFEAAAIDAVARFGRGPYLIRQIGAPPVTLPASVMFPLYAANKVRL